MARKRSDIGTRIVIAARQRFLQDGVDGASQRQIARDAGTNLGMIYYYYPTKNDLFLAVAEQIYAGLLADVTSALRDDVDVEARLRRLFARLAALTDDEFDVIRIVMREVLVSSERRHRIVEMFQRGHLPLLVATIFEGMRSGALRMVDHPMLPVVFTIALGLFPQIARRLVLAEHAGFAPLPSADGLAEAAFQTLMDGLRASPTRIRRPAPKNQKATPRRVKRKR